MTTTILTGDCREVLPTLPDGSVQTCVTSPPYFGLRDYGVVGQIGLEATVEAFVAELVSVFREVRRVLADDGTLWLNLGDSYNAQPGQRKTTDKAGPKQLTNAGAPGAPSRFEPSLVPKNLIGVPWRVAFALQADGWILRQDIIWSKPNPMPESVTDRCTKSHEYLFLLTKAPQYYFNAAAIAEPVAPATVERLSQPNLANQEGSDRVPGKTNGAMKAVAPASHKGSSFDKGKTAEHQLGRAQRGPRFGGQKYGDSCSKSTRRYSGNEYSLTDKRNRRSVWTISTQPFKDAHFATFPETLVEPCILAGSREGDTVLDPFGGSGTTAGVANRLGRHSIVIELNPEYIPMIERRTAQLPLEVPA